MNKFLKLCESEVFLENATADFLLECLGDDDIETDDFSEEQVSFLSFHSKSFQNSFCSQTSLWQILSIYGIPPKNVIGNFYCDTTCAVKSEGSPVGSKLLQV